MAKNKVLDEKGRLFGKVNIVDLLIVLVIIAAVAFVGIKYVLPKVQPKPEAKPQGAEMVWEVVFVEAGKDVIGQKGTEIILRVGDATVVDYGINGIPDLSYGYEILNGEHVAANHSLLVPQSDGRGVHTETDCWFMICGIYIIQ